KPVFGGKFRDGRKTNRRQAKLSAGMQKIRDNEPGRRSQVVRSRIGRPPADYEKPGRQAKETQCEFKRNGGVDIPCGKGRPEPSEQGGEQNYENGIDRLQPAGGNQPVAHHAVGALIGKEVERGAGLFKARPENGSQNEQPEDNPKPFLFRRGMAAGHKQENKVKQHKNQDAVSQSGCDFFHRELKHTQRYQVAEQRQQQYRRCRKEVKVQVLPFELRRGGVFLQQAGVAKKLSSETVLDQS